MIENKKPYFIVVGGVNVDISGTPSGPMLAGDSNPGKITMTPGGVGRNIAENLCRLGMKTYMLTALGDDAYADFIRKSCDENGIDLSYALTATNMSSSTYLCLNDAFGELYAAVSDMAVCDRISSAYLEANRDLLNGAAMVIADANIPEEAIEWLTMNCTAPLAADPVSVRKAAKLRGRLNSFIMLKPNRPEASLLTDVEIQGLEGVEEAAQVMLDQGVKDAFISLGAGGVYFSDGEHHGIQLCCPSAIRNTTGCGDAFLAAAALAWVEGRPIAEMALMGQAASAICAEADSAVNPAMTKTMVLDRMYTANS